MNSTLSTLSFVNHPLLKPNTLKKRKYQLDIFVTCTKTNCLVVVPTGLGKTVIALLLSIHQIQKYGGKVIFLAPTKPLVEQHHKSFLDLTIISSESLKTLTGATAPEKRKKIHEKTGNAIESIYSEKLEDYYELLAYHYVEINNR